jgi:CheY-like chemotaxis protein/signal transduction histidine kinase
METLARLIDRRAPLEANAVCADAAARFEAEPEAYALAVVEAGHPVGLIPREIFLARLAADTGLAGQPVTAAMDPDPIIAPAGQSAAAFRSHVLATRPADLLRGFIAVEDGRFAGVGTAVSLLHARRDRSGGLRRAESALIQRLNQDAGARLDGAMAFAERLAEEPLGEDARAWVGAIARTSQSVRDLLTRAADLHQARAGMLPFERKPHRLRDLIDQLEARWSGRAAEAGATLLVSYDGDPEFAAEIDAERLMQVFDALIGRALAQPQARGYRGAVEAALRARPVLQGVMLEGSVRDSGAPAPPERLARLFEPLGLPNDPGDSATGDDLSVGLGMALARRIVSVMDGTIAAEANVGAGVTVSFQMVAPEAAAAPAAAPSTERPAAHILIVDDNATNRLVVEALCEMFDCTSEQAEDGVEAVEAARSRPFDLILMDIRMPRMDGVAATRAIRALPGRAGRTPIIALTANADPEDARTYLAAGMNGVVEKPIKPELLLAALEQALPADDESAAA